MEYPQPSTNSLRPKKLSNQACLSASQECPLCSALIRKSKPESGRDEDRKSKVSLAQLYKQEASTPHGQRLRQLRGIVPEVKDIMEATNPISRLLVAV